MCKVVKMSKYNFFVYDSEENLIVYNFLTGINSLVKIMRSDVKKFKELFMKDKEIPCDSIGQYTKVMDVLLQLGILVFNDINENILYEAKYYKEIYDNKLSLVILPTGKCNFNCAYCFETEQDFFRQPMSLESQNAIIKFVQKEIHNYKELKVCWFGGEPLLEPQAIKYLSENFMKICQARFIPYSAEIDTNGFGLDGDMFDMLYKLKVYNYMVTIDGFKDQHDKLRFTRNGLGTYDVIMKNLLRIRNSKQYKFAHITIRVNITKSVLEVIDDFIDFMDSTFNDDPRFSFVFVPAKNYSITKSSDNIFVDEGEVSSKISKNKVYINKLQLESLKTHIIFPGKGCVANSKNSYVIAPDLKVYKCCAHYDMKDNNIGYIELNGRMVLNEYLHSRWYLSNEFIQRKPEHCMDCFYMPVCNNSGKYCPEQYIKENPKHFFCPLDKDDFSMALKKSILYAVDKYSCKIIEL